MPRNLHMLKASWMSFFCSKNLTLAWGEKTPLTALYHLLVYLSYLGSLALLPHPPTPYPGCSLGFHLHLLGPGRQQRNRIKPLRTPGFTHNIQWIKNLEVILDLSFPNIKSNFKFFFWLLLFLINHKAAVFI